MQPIKPTPSSVSLFLELPLEIRQLILDHAYGDERKITPVLRNMWEYNEKIRKRRERGRSDFQVSLSPMPSPFFHPVQTLTEQPYLSRSNSSPSLP